MLESKSRVLPLDDAPKWFWDVIIIKIDNIQKQGNYMLRKKLITCLYQIVADDKPLGQNFIKSGNILNKLQEIGMDAALELADSYFNRVAKEKEVYEKGYLLGRLNKRKLNVFRIEFPPNILFFIGTEADVLRKIEQYQKDKVGTEEEN